VDEPPAPGPGVTTPLIDDLIARARAAGAAAAKVCGAGGGGCLFCYGPPDRKEEIKAALTAGGARVLDFTFEHKGLLRG
jgi:D-glycero-alpha-D-manno-heptose-7-phosphate kinase